MKTYDELQHEISLLENRMITLKKENDALKAKRKSEAFLGEEGELYWADADGYINFMDINTMREPFLLIGPGDIKGFSEWLCGYVSRKG